MWKLATNVRAAVTLIAGLFLAPLLLDGLKTLLNKYVWQQPQEDAGWLFALVGPWFYDAAAFAGGLLLGVWLDWVLREADGSRAARVRQVGLRLSNLGHYLEAQLGVHGSLPTSSYDVAPEIVSALIRAERLRVWVPTLELGGREMVNYLRSIGMLLADGHLAQARAAAKDIRAGITSRLGFCYNDAHGRRGSRSALQM